MKIRIVIFLILNFAALGAGSYFTSDGVASDWYNNLNKAPWTPPGWFFGFAWTSIMICFSLYMTAAWEETKNRNTLIIAYIFQWILNVIWNPIFFSFHQVILALGVIILLCLLVAFFYYKYKKELKLKSLLILPYLIWLVVASSLNAYVLFMN